MEHLLGHMVAPFQEVIHAWTAQGSLYNPSLLHVDRVLVGTVSVPIPRLAQEHAVPKAAPKHHSWDEDSASLGPINLTPQPGYCLKEPGFHLQAVFVPSWGPCWWARAGCWGWGVPFPGCLWNTCALSPALPPSRLTCQVVEEFGLCCGQSEVLVENCPCVKIKRRECHVPELPSPGAAEGAGTRQRSAPLPPEQQEELQWAELTTFTPLRPHLWGSCRAKGPQGCLSPKPSCLPHRGGLCPSRPAVPRWQWRSPRWLWRVSS